MNSLDMLVVEGQELTRAENIQKEIVNYYEKLYAETENWRLIFNMQECPAITEEENHNPMTLFDSR